MSLVTSSAPRIDELVQWLEQSGFLSPKLVAMTGDAGFRRYYRFTHGASAYIAVDAPPRYCNNAAFFAIANQLAEQGIKTPAIYAHDLDTGFFCLEDFGAALLADVLTDNSMAAWYRQAIAILPTIAQTPVTAEMKTFDQAFVETELAIFTEWLLANYLGLTLTEQEKQILETSFTILADNILAQPQVFMHRDFHSRNLMVLSDTLTSESVPSDKQTSEKTFGVIDFQDAVLGPITYDVVSLLRDCYVKWPTEQITPLLTYFVEQMTATGNYSEISFETWQRWFDLTGLQRHIKASGIFARLLLRDGKAGYIKDIPLTLSYIVDIASTYPELGALANLVRDKVIPALTEKALAETAASKTQLSKEQSQ
ncbi:aminoglycoside phosphotransferase family protein [Thalassotalea euphylliae]|uniref:aminoglycoside phosphotransferase family protein n=1 Tax=Thalassotalea euphylliae TaxID=1655234 RepID=UPI00216350A7|nr:phosphotransferase [Thalassotalea euphylliae]